MKMKTCFVLFTVTFFCLSPFARAATRTWDGGGANGNWSNATNWVGDAAPVSGDDLVFPLGAANLSPLNNFPANTTFNSITISGTNYVMDGARVALNAGINATNTTDFNYFLIPFTLNSNQSIVTGNTDVNLFVYGDIDMNGKDLTFSGNGQAQVSSIISGTGGLIKNGSGRLFLYASNTFSGAAQINQGSVTIHHGNALGSTSGSTMVVSGAILVLNNSITVPEPLVLSGALFASTFGKTLTGPITLATNINITVSSGAGITVNSVISGPGGFTIVIPSVGFVTLNSNNTYAGTTTVNSGALFVNGNQSNSVISFNGGLLGGKGSVGTITVGNNAQKSLVPGTNGPGILTCSDIILDQFSTLRVDVNGTTLGSQYDQLNVNGSVTLSNASLFTASTGVTLSGGEQFVIINNDGADAISGTFNGLPEGATVNVGTNQLKISYVGATGNDVVLFNGNPPAHLTAITPLTNGVKQINGLGLSNLTYTIQGATNLNPTIAWTNLGSATANGNGVFNFNDTNALLLPMRFYRAKSP
ncbi:MAG: autotransporter-associated beta strand repeat-containing protein [Verrucomicrobiota bacterium]